MDGHAGRTCPCHTWAEGGGQGAAAGKANGIRCSRTQAGPVWKPLAGEPAGLPGNVPTTLWCSTGSPERCGWNSMARLVQTSKDLPRHATGRHAERVERTLEVHQNQRRALPPTGHLHHLLLRNLRFMLEAEVKCLQFSHPPADQKADIRGTAFNQSSSVLIAFARQGENFCLTKGEREGERSYTNSKNIF